MNIYCLQSSMVLTAQASSRNILLKAHCTQITPQPNYQLTGTPVKCIAHKLDMFKAALSQVTLHLPAAACLVLRAHFSEGCRPRKTAARRLAPAGQLKSQFSLAVIALLFPFLPVVCAVHAHISAATFFLISQSF